MTDKFHARATTDRTRIGGRLLPTITDEVLRERLGQTRRYTVDTRPYTLGLLLQVTTDIPNAETVVWEHMRRMLALLEDGVLVTMFGGTAAGDPDWGGLGVFDSTPDEVRAILETDPLVEAGACRFEIHPVTVFPGS